MSWPWRTSSLEAGVEVGVVLYGCRTKDHKPSCLNNTFVFLMSHFVERKSGQALMDSLVKVTQDQCQVFARLVSSLEALEGLGICFQALLVVSSTRSLATVRLRSLPLAGCQSGLSTPSGQTLVLAHCPSVPKSAVASRFFVGFEHL